MPYLRDVRNSLLIAHDQGLVSDEELMLLLKATSSKNPEFSYEKYARFSIEEPECLSEFRVGIKDLPLLADALRLPDTLHRLQSENHCRQVRGVMYFAQANVVSLFVCLFVYYLATLVTHHNIAKCSQDSADPFLNLA